MNEIKDENGKVYRLGNIKNFLLEMEDKKYLEKLNYEDTKKTNIIRNVFNLF